MATSVASRLALALLGVTTAIACDASGLDYTTAPTVPLAYVRFVNAVPDTGGTDWRFIDQVEYSPAMFGMPFRFASSYQGARAGNRKLRIFPTSTNIDVTSQWFIDTTLTLNADTYYTIIHLGYTRAGQSPADQIVLLIDTLPTLPSDSFALRAVHLGIGLNNQDVFATRLTTNPLPASPLFTSVAYGSRTVYVSRALDSLALRSTNTTTVTVNATAAAPAGAPFNPDSNRTAIGGSLVGKSVLSAFYFPRSVAGSSAPQSAAFQVPALVYLTDRHPR